MTRITPLDAWAAAKIGLVCGPLDRGSLEWYQQRKLAETIRFAVENSPFYRKRLGRHAARGVDSLADIAALPFTTAEELREQGSELLCVSQTHISRVVTLNTSGTLGVPKRLWFTPEDQKSTVEFFRAGMSTLVSQGDRALILLPGERSDGVGDLLAQALINMGVVAIPHGLVRSLEETLKIMTEKKVDSVVGIPVQILALARYSAEYGYSSIKPRSVLLSTDYAAVSLIREVERIWNCEVFDHYGMTEMGLGGGVECAAHTGYHLREADLYFEIIDPDSGEQAPDGETGEVVFSTLTRRGMPLIRYRTGDLSRFLPEPCVCGSVLKRLDRVYSRQNSSMQLPDGTEVHWAAMDEALFTVRGVIDFSMDVADARDRLKVVLSLLTLAAGTKVEQEVFERIGRIPQLAAALKSGRLELTIQATQYVGSLPTVAAKRTFRKVMG
ncbi:MAG: DVU_1553 family AMP-dependent CoA ligase [Negativicutes bacterium]